MKPNISENLKKKLHTLKQNILQGKFLYTFAVEHGYSAEVIELLANKDLSSETLNILEEQRKNSQFSHLSDNRNIYDYDFNLIAAWVLEDYIIDNSYGVFERNGSDKERSIIPKENIISNQSDLKNKLTYRDVEVHSEYFFRNGKFKDATINLRDNKYANLMRKDAELLIINIPTRTFLLRNITDFNATYIEHYEKFGGKSVYSLSLEDIGNEFRPLSELFENLKEKSETSSFL